MNRFKRPAKMPSPCPLRRLPTGLRVVSVSLLALPALALYAQDSASIAADNKTGTNTSLSAGIALAKQGKLDGAIETFEKALERDPNNPSLLDATGAAYNLKGDLNRAQEYFLKCLDVDPDFAPAHKNLAITYFVAGRYNLADAEFQKLKNGLPDAKLVANLFLGMIAEKKNAHLEAARLLADSGTLLDQYPDALLCLAEAEFHLRHVQKAQDALALFEKAHDITRPQYLQAGDLYSRLAHLAQEIGDLGSALRSLRQAAKLNPSREDNYLDFITICSDYGNYPLALEGAEIGLEHIPDSYRLLVQKGVVLEGLGRLDEAETVLGRAGELQPDNSVALLSLSIVQTHAGQLQNAEATLASALKNFPDNYYMHYQRGKILLKLQEGNSTDADLYAKAKQEFQAAIRCNPSYADSYYQLAKLLLEDSPKMAEQNFVACLRRDPSHGPAEYALARLYLSTGKRAAGQQLIDRFERQRQADKVQENRRPRIELAHNQLSP